ncbi:hypothetical protein FALBO_16232, partial [Fusarium albosuccineum]
MSDRDLKPWHKKALENNRRPLPDAPGERPWVNQTVAAVAAAPAPPPVGNAAPVAPGVPAAPNLVASGQDAPVTTSPAAPAVAAAAPAAAQS